jgi:hypothetical protein
MQRNNSLYASRFSNSLRGGMMGPLPVVGALDAQVAAAPCAAGAAPEQLVMADALVAANNALNAALANPAAGNNPNAFNAADAAATRAVQLSGVLGGAVAQGDIDVAGTISNTVAFSQARAAAAQAAAAGAVAAASQAKDSELDGLLALINAYSTTNSANLSAAKDAIRAQLAQATNEVNNAAVVAPSAAQQASLASHTTAANAIMAAHPLVLAAKQQAEAAAAALAGVSGQLQGLQNQFTVAQIRQRQQASEAADAADQQRQLAQVAAARQQAAAAQAAQQAAASQAAAANTPAALAASAAAARRAAVAGWMFAPSQGGGAVMGPAPRVAARTPDVAFDEGKNIIDGLNNLVVSNAPFNYVPPAGGAAPTKSDIINEIIPSLDSTNVGAGNVWPNLGPILANVEKPFNGKNMLHVPKSDEVLARAISVALNGHLPISAGRLFYGDYYQTVTPTQLNQYKALFALNADVASKWDRQVDNIRQVVSSYGRSGGSDTIPADAQLNGPRLVKLSALSNYTTDLKGKVVTKRNTPPTAGVAGASEAVRSLVISAAAGGFGMKGGNANPHAPLYPTMVMKGGAHPFARFNGGDVDATKVLTDKINRLLAKYQQLTGAPLAGTLQQDITNYSGQVKTNLDEINKSLEVLYNGNNAIARFPPGLGSSYPTSRAELEAYGNKIAELNKAADKTAKRINKLTDIHDLVQDLVTKLEAQSPAKFQ